MNLAEIAALYNASGCTVLREINSGYGETDRRHTYLLSFADGQRLAVKVCKNLFTTAERISGWKTLCKHHLDLGIYCPQIVDSLEGHSSETVFVEGERFVIYAEEIAKYPSMEDVSPRPDYESIRPGILKALGILASHPVQLTPWPSVYCLYDTFDPDDETDENYEWARDFCAKVRKEYPQHSAYVDKIWDVFLEKREAFEPIYRRLPKASFQADLNASNLLVNENLEFAGLIDFNLCGTECVLYFFMLPDVCSYRLQRDDIEQLNNAEFRKKCDDFFYDNLRLISRYYSFTEFERQSFCLCYNTAVPFCYYMINDKLDIAIEKNNTEAVEAILDWVYDQLTRDDLILPI